MKKQTKVWLCIAAFLVVVGCIFFGSVMTVLKWDFTKLSTVTYETNTYELTDNYKNISIVTTTADILFVPSDDGESKVVCYEEKNLSHKVTVQNDTLTVWVVNEKKWYEYIGTNFGTPKITVYMPPGTYAALNVKSNTGDVEIPKEFAFESMDIEESTGDVINRASASDGIKIKTTTGNIQVENISADTLNLTVSTGRVTVTDVTCTGDVAVNVSTGKTYLTNVTCAGVTTGGNTGDVSLKNVVAENILSVVRSTGDVTFDGCDAAEIFVKTDTGRVKGSLLTEKVFITQSDTGRVTVPETTSGGRCQITTDTGDIYITVQDNSTR